MPAARRTDAVAQGTRLYGIMRDVSEQYVAEGMLRTLLLSTSFDLRINAQNVASASALLLLHEAVRSDPEAAFLAAAVQSSCNLLLGAPASLERAGGAWLTRPALQAWYLTSSRCGQLQAYAARLSPHAKPCADAQAGAGRADADAADL